MKPEAGPVPCVHQHLVHVHQHFVMYTSGHSVEHIGM